MDTDRSSVLQWLIQRIQAGDEGAIGELVVAAQRRLRALAGTILNCSFRDVKERGRCDTEELTQELSARLLEALTDAPLNDVKHLIRIAAQHIKWHLQDMVKRPPPRPTDSLPEPRQESSSSVVDAASAGQRQQARPSQAQIVAKLRELLGKLAQPLQEVVDLKIIGGLTHDEIAEHLHVSTKTIQRNWDRAVLTLHDGLVTAFPELARPESGEVAKNVN